MADFIDLFRRRKKPQPFERYAPPRARCINQSLSLTIQSSGKSTLLQCLSERIVIDDLIVQTQANNTFQIFAGIIAITPVLTFTADQPASFSDIILNWPDSLYIVCGNNSAVAVSIRYRVIQG